MRALGVWLRIVIDWFVEVLSRGVAHLEGAALWYRTQRIQSEGIQQQA